MVKHVLVDLIVSGSDEVYEKLKSALSECTLMYMSSLENSKLISLYNCRSVLVATYRFHREILIDVLGDEEEVTYKIISVLPQEKIIIRFIERGFASSSFK